MFFVCVVFRVWWKTNRTRTAILPPAKVEGWERDFGPAVLLSLCVVWVFLLVHHMVPPLPTKTLRRCCLLLWRPTETDTPKKKKKIPPPGSVSAQLFPPALGECLSGLLETQIQDQSIHAMRWNISRCNRLVRGAVPNERWLVTYSLRSLPVLWTSPSCC